MLTIYYLAEPALLPEAQTQLRNFRGYVNITNSAVFTTEKKNYSERTLELQKQAHTL